jgi:hypothetical protein
MMPAGPDPTTTTSHFFSHHIASDEDDAVTDEDTDVGEDELLDGSTLWARTRTEGARRRNRCTKVNNDTIIEEEE